MVSIRAHYDGKVFVPDEPVDVPPNSRVRLLLVEDSSVERPLLGLLRVVEQVPDDPSWPPNGAVEHDHHFEQAGFRALLRSPAPA